MEFCAVHAYGEVSVIRDADWILKHLDGLSNLTKSTMENESSPCDYIEIMADNIVGKYQDSQQYQQLIREIIAEGLMKEPNPKNREVAKMMLSPKSAHDVKKRNAI